MTVPPYTVLCDCGAPATHKVAANWSDGIVVELKTYALCCQACAGGALESAVKRRAACQLTHGETLDQPAILARAVTQG